MTLFHPADFDRRSFLKGAAAATGLHLLPQSGLGANHKSGLPSPPTLSSLASDPVSHLFRDLYNTPSINNEWGYLKATKSVSGLTALSFPPYACCGAPEIAFSPGDLATCEIFLNGRMLMGYPPPATRVTYTWYPHQFVREAIVDALEFKTHSFMPTRQRVAAQTIVVTNPGKAARAITLGFDLRAGVVRKTDPWFVGSPAESDNRITPMLSRGCLVFEAQHSRAVSVQGLLPRPDRVDGSRMLVLNIKLGPGESREVRYVNAIAEDKTAALELYDHAQANFSSIQEERERLVAGLLRSAFTPGNSDFSGHLPQLLTEDASLWKLYHGGLPTCFSLVVVPRTLCTATPISPWADVLYPP
jgi:hypothetical protein